MEQQHKSGHEASQCETTVFVNEQPVTLTVGPHTALEIKQDAIEAGLPIETDFVLSVEDEPRHTRIVGDDETIDVEAGCRFVAIPDDDNS